MEKICTRCNFRTPAARVVCQVCGYSKFRGSTDAQGLDAKQLPVVIAAQAPVSVALLVDMLRQTKNAALNLATTVANALKHSTATVESQKRDEPAIECSGAGNDFRPMRSTASFRSSNISTPVFQDGEDLDSMIAWFKSYGVDRPLILEPNQQSSVEHNCKAA